MKQELQHLSKVKVFTVLELSASGKQNCFNCHPIGTKQIELLAYLHEVLSRYRELDPLVLADGHHLIFEQFQLIDLGNLFVFLH
jgi:hypothetical protein